MYVDLQYCVWGVQKSMHVYSSLYLLVSNSTTIVMNSQGGRTAHSSHYHQVQTPPPFVGLLTSRASTPLTFVSISLLSSKSCRVHLPCEITSQTAVSKENMVFLIFKFLQSRAEFGVDAKWQFMTFTTGLLLAHILFQGSHPLRRLQLSSTNTWYQIVQN